MSKLAKQKFGLLPEIPGKSQNHLAIESNISHTLPWARAMCELRLLKTTSERKDHYHLCASERRLDTVAEPPAKASHMGKTKIEF